MPATLRPPDTDVTLCVECAESRTDVQPLRREFGPQQYVCDDCVDVDAFPECERCGERAWEDETNQTVDAGRVCIPCRRRHYTQCDDCSDYASDGTVREAASGAMVCPDCRRHGDWEECDGCGYLYHDYELDDDDRCYDCRADCDCVSCRPESHGGGLIRDYSYRPVPQFLGDGPLYLGMELEITTPDVEECATLANDMAGEISYLKYDGSISCGFELVTHPMSYAYASDSFPWQLLSRLEDAGARVETSSNGLHVHVSRAAFDGPCHVYRWLKLIYRNEDNVTRLARRESNDWAAFSGSHRRSHKDFAKGARHGERYSAVNVQNSETFELRFFASTLKATEARAALAFAHASVEYARSIRAHDVCARGAWSWPAFGTWIREQGIYPDLMSAMEMETV